MNTSTAELGTVSHPVVSADRWVAERKALLAREKELTRLRDQVARERRALPWVRIDKDYVFDTPDGPRRLGELFDGRSQLLVQHFMFAPGWEQGCPSCSFLADHIDGTLIHLAHRDVTLVAVSRAPLGAKLVAQPRELLLLRQMRPARRQPRLLRYDFALHRFLRCSGAPHRRAR